MEPSQQPGDDQLPAESGVPGASDQSTPDDSAAKRPVRRRSRFYRTKAAVVVMPAPESVAESSPTPSPEPAPSAARIESRETVAPAQEPPASPPPPPVGKLIGEHGSGKSGNSGFLRGGRPRRRIFTAGRRVRSLFLQKGKAAQAETGQALVGWAAGRPAGRQPISTAAASAQLCPGVWGSARPLPFYRPGGARCHGGRSGLGRRRTGQSGGVVWAGPGRSDRGGAGIRGRRRTAPPTAGNCWPPSSS